MFPNGAARALHGPLHLKDWGLRPIRANRGALVLKLLNQLLRAVCEAEPDAALGVDQLARGRNILINLAPQIRDVTFEDVVPTDELIMTQNDQSRQETGGFWQSS